MPDRHVPENEPAARRNLVGVVPVTRLNMVAGDAALQAGSESV
jgi:hypothetical protein